MSQLRSPIPSSAYKIVVFATVTITLTGLLASLVGNLSLAPSTTYQALFTDATGVSKGDRVRLAGVEVGSVNALRLVDFDGRRVARLSFRVERSVPVLHDAHLTLRYENIVGNRYLEISESPGTSATMEPGGTFPLTHTTPALDLTTLFNGFQPLFRALSPHDLNTFSYELIQALQGESGSLAGLMKDTASLTNTLADRDAVIGRVVTNLDTVLQTVGDRDDRLTSLIVQFRNLMHGLSQQRDVIDKSLPSLGALLGESTTLIRSVRPALKTDIGALGAVSGQLSTDSSALDSSLKRLPSVLNQYARTASYGSWFNFYVCGLNVDLALPGGSVDLAGAGAASNERDVVCGGATP